MSTTIARPVALPVDADGIPELLKSQATWVCWRYFLKNGKWTKPPYTARNMSRYASTTDPKTWTMFQDALSAYENPRNQFDGIGLVLMDGIAGVDLDHVIDGDVVEPWSGEILDRFGATYIERSPGGDGLRIFARGKPAHCGKGGPDNRLEVYDRTSPRYLTVTGQHWNGSAPDIVDAQDALDWLHDKYMVKPGSETKAKSVNPPGTPGDDEIIQRASAAANGSKFTRLWSGDAGEDHSSADLALCSVLAFWTRDAAQIDRIFRRSGLMRDKWDERRGEQTYGAITIDKALTVVTETYSGPKARPQEQAAHADDGDGGEDRSSGDQAVINRLAKLKPIDYDKVRKVEADALGIRASTLDAQVLESRRQLPGNDDAGAGTCLTFDTIEPWPGPVDGGELLNEIHTIFTRHAVLPEHSADALALWAIFTHMHAASPVCPMLLLSSPVKGCGKTTVLSVLHLLVNRPLAASNVTAAAMFRAIEAWTPTLLIDEADSFARDNEELRGVLNSGHTRTSAFVLRTVGDDHEPKQFSTWCPKALAGIGKLPGTVMDRSVIVGMRRKSRGEQVQRLRPRQRYDDTRSKIARWAGDHLAEFDRADPVIPGDLANRTADNWTPLLAIADLAGGDWPERARAAAMGMSEIDIDGDGVGVRLLADIRMLFTSRGKTRYFTAELLRDLLELDESPWSEFNRGKPFNPRGLARLLGGFDIVVTTIRYGGEVSKGYKLEQFADAFERYLAPEVPFSGSQSVTPSQPNGGAGCNGIQKRYTPNGVTDSKPLQASTGAGCNDVTDSNPGNSGFAQSASNVEGDIDL